MKESIKSRIEAVQRGGTPEGYHHTKDIGIAPKEWRVGQLKDVLHNEQRPVPKPDAPYWRLGIRSWAKGTFHAYVEDPEMVDMDELYVVKENDLVVNITFAWEHAVAIAGQADDGLLVSHRFPTYVFDGENSPAFFSAVIAQRCFKDMLDHISPGGAGRNRVLNRKDFLELPCYIPPVAEQQKIAEILATCDKVIELKKKLLEEKCRQKHWLINKLVLAIEAVDYLPLSKLCELICDGDWIESKDQSEDGVRLIQTGNIGIGMYLDKESRARYISEETFLKLHCTEVLPGDVLVSRLPDPLGRACVIPKLESKAITAVDCTILRFSDDYIARYFIQYSTSQQYFNRLTKLSGGSTRTRISRKELENLPIPIPTDRKLIHKVVEILLYADKEIELLKYEVSLLEQKKKVLMQLLLTGLVRVNA